MINKESISRETFASHREQTAKRREDINCQDESLADTRLLRMFAIENNLKDATIELFFEEVLILQHFFMETQDQKHLQAMKITTNQADKYIKENSLTHWESRLARFNGRVFDYEKKYSEAAQYYQEAIAKVSLDPKYLENMAIGLEYEGFLIIDKLHLGNSDAVSEAEKLYRDYLDTEEGRNLKIRDYTTWAIWRSGVLINLCRTLIELNKTEDYRDKIQEWLKLAEADLQAPVGVQVWSDFGFRKNEIIKIRESI